MRGDSSGATTRLTRYEDSWELFACTHPQIWIIHTPQIVAALESSLRRESPA